MKIHCGEAFRLPIRSACPAARGASSQLGRTQHGAVLAACIGLVFGSLFLSPARVFADGKDPKDAKPAAAKAAPPLPPLTEDNEVKMGREAAEENDKQVKFVTDAAIVERVNKIGQDIAAVANKFPIDAKWGSSQLKVFKYSFKVVDDKDVNAYSLPGGFIYVDKGLLDFTHSDDELAGVLAHEVTHAMHHHMVKLIREQNKMNTIMVPLQVIAMIAMMSGKGGSNDAQALLMGSQLYTIAKMNTYGVEAEKDADRGAILLLQHTKYNPVGLYSFMLRLAALEQRQNVADLGIYRTHPPGPERAESAKALLTELSIPIKISQVDPQLRAAITVTKTGANGAELAEIRMRSILICKIAGSDGLTAAQRAEKVAARLNDLMDMNLQAFEVKVSKDQTKVTARGQLIFTDADAQAQQKSLLVLSHEFADAVSQYYLKQQMETAI